MKKIAIVGIGGRTGAMFAQELKASNFVLGIGREKEVEEIEKGNLLLKRGGRSPEVFAIEMIKDSEFRKNPIPDAIFLCTKNPINSVVKYYYQIIKERGEKIPALFISQNGVVAIDEAKQALKEIFGENANQVQVIRISLFNSVGREAINEKVYLTYSLPIRLSFGPVSGSFQKGEIKDIFDKAGFEAEEVSVKKARNMELSKFFLNLIGMASASHGVSVEEGFKDSKIFKEEVGMLREYINIVQARGGDFLNFKDYYPVKLLACLFNFLPVGLLSVFRGKIGRLIDRGRKGKKKDLDEIEYYNGAVVSMGKEVGRSVIINQEIIKRVSNKK